MSETLEARDFIVDFLRRELVGPSPGYPAIQVDGEEILRAQDPPRQRYSAGVLFPLSTEILSQDGTAESEELVGEAESPNPDVIIHSQENEILESEAQNTDSSIPDTEAEVSLANEHLPSAMGLTALVEKTKSLRVDVSVGEYKQKEFNWETRTKGGQEYTPKAWWRHQKNASIQLDGEELFASGTAVFQKPILVEEGQTALALHVVSRPSKGSESSPRTRLITFTLINRRRKKSDVADSAECFFQCGFTIRSTSDSNPFLAYPERIRTPDDPDELTLQLLYLHKQTFAIGHGCAADWSEPMDGRTALIRSEVLPTYELKPVLPTQLEGLKLRMFDLASEETQDVLDLCTELTSQYSAWIHSQERDINSRTDLTHDLKQTANRHIDNCHKCLSRISDGISLLKSDVNVALAFRLMNEAMLMQQIHYQISTQKIRAWEHTNEGPKIDGSFERPSYNDLERTWRPFQLAFVLMNLRAIADPTCPERDLVDVIWFPTGGGKTEAYLGLSAYAMFLRRLRNPMDAGTSILMRYTLRLLTTQQFQRASSLICACEVIRRRESEKLGKERFSIGIWVGGEVTPNTQRDAVNALRQLTSGRGINKFILLSCPWCGTAMGPQRFGQRTMCKGYRKLAHPARVRLVCEDPDCDFSSEEGLPLEVIDEQIYESPPTLLIGTVDKFAMLAFQPLARRLFGLGTSNSPPELIIQDELHLISGPLGSMVGHYETAVDALCMNEVAGSRIRAKFVASTATISHAANQVKDLYGRAAFLFPPQALKAGDSFFAEERNDQAGRLYVGMFASALPSHVSAQVRTMGALLQAPKLFSSRDPEAIDPYWTMMGYFNSLRELGHAATLIRADIREYLNAMWDRLGMYREAIRDEQIDPRRFINRDVELTSRVQSSDIPGILQQLFSSHSDPKKTDAIDVCFATNMIQVGLDIPRLSLMTIVGQPKTTAEYIQASSRVGRALDRPGIVVTNYNPFKPRDRSHYEHFRSYHHNIYQHVEPTSVTPFALPVRDRALHALVVILSRFWGDEQLRITPTHPPNDELRSKIKAAIRARVMSSDPSEWPRTEARLDFIFHRWAQFQPSLYGRFGSPSEETPLMYPAGSQKHPNWLDWPFSTPSSMRNVDADCAARQMMAGYGETEDM